MLIKATEFESNIKSHVIGPGDTLDDVKENLTARGMPHAGSLRFCLASGPWLNNEKPLSEQGVTSTTTVHVMLPLGGGVRQSGPANPWRRVLTPEPNPRGAGAPMGPPRMGRTGQQSALGSGDGADPDGADPWIRPRSVI